MRKFQVVKILINTPIVTVSMAQRSRITLGKHSIRHISIDKIIIHVKECKRPTSKMNNVGYHLRNPYISINVLFSTLALSTHL
jgi:hypothetical protein